MFRIKHFNYIFSNLRSDWLHKVRPNRNNTKIRCYCAAAAYKIDIKVNNTCLNDYIEKLKKEYETSLSSDTNFLSNSRYVTLKPVIEILTDRNGIIENINSLEELISSNDVDLSNLAKEEKLQLEDKLKDLDAKLLEVLLPSEDEDSCNSIVLEINAGVGGQEAMLFAQDIFDMYCAFINLKGWEYEIADYFTTEMGGVRHASILVNGPRVFQYFKYEGGVHRVQRVPSTEKSGRIHTSTVSVVALPQPSDIDVHLDQKELKIETKRSTGAGGQHVNTTDSAVRIIHLPTNISVECQVDRSQIKNRKLAMAKLSALLYQRELESQQAQLTAKRKSQVKSNNRNEKIRTYNYNQDRITDHRLNGVHFHNLSEFIKHGNGLEKLLEQLDRHTRLNRLLEIVEESFK